jgi:hypothetical protein
LTATLAGDRARFVYPLGAVRNVPAGEYENGYSEFTVGGFAQS